MNKLSWEHQSKRKEKKKTNKQTNTHKHKGPNAEAIPQPFAYKETFQLILLMLNQESNNNYKGKIHFTHLRFGPFTSCLPVVSKLTLCPPEILFLNSCYPHLTAVQINSHHKLHKHLIKLHIVILSLSPLASDSPSELDILMHDSDPLDMNSGKIGVLEETHNRTLLC